MPLDDACIDGVVEHSRDSAGHAVGRLDPVANALHCLHQFGPRDGIDGACADHRIGKALQRGLDLLSMLDVRQGRLRPQQPAPGHLLERGHGRLGRRFRRLHLDMACSSE